MGNEIATMRRTLAPTTFAEAFQFAEQLAKSSMVPAEYRGKPENILLAVQWGQELGLAPLQAIQSIAVINGKPSIYGDALIAVVRGSLTCDDVIETFEGEGDKFTAICEARRRGKAAVVAQFSVADAKLAGLWGKAGPWKQYPRRMLQMRARGFALRDAFPDLLRGVITREEADDYPVDVGTRRAPTDVTPRTDLDAFAALPSTETADMESGEIIEEISDDDLWPAADAAAKRGTQAFRDWWKGLPTAKRDLLRADIPQYQATAAAADRSGAEEDDPFGLPPLPSENSPPAQPVHERNTGGLGGPAPGGEPDQSPSRPAAALGPAAGHPGADKQLPAFQAPVEGASRRGDEQELGQSLGAVADEPLTRFGPALGNRESAANVSDRPQSDLLDGDPAENLTVPLPVRPTTDQFGHFARQVMHMIGETSSTPHPQRMALIRQKNAHGIGLLKTAAVAQYDEVMAALAKPARTA